MLHTLYKTHFGKAPHKSSPLAKAGSNRQYFRLEDEQGASVIGVIGTDVTENRCFVYLCQHFYDKALPVPQILACAEDLQNKISCLQNSDEQEKELQAELDKAQKHLLKLARELHEKGLEFSAPAKK